MTMPRFLPWAGTVALLCLVGAPDAAAAGEAAPPADVIVTVTGESAHSFEDAREDALRKAIEMGAGKEIFSDTRIADFALMHDTIVSRAAGYMRVLPDILEKKVDQGVYKVTIRATVALGKIKDDWGAIQVIIQREGRPNLLVVCTEEIIHYPTGQPLPGTGNIAESRLRNRFLRTEKGDKLFDLIDDETLAKKVGRDVTRAMLARDEDRAVAVANQLNADFLVLVTAKARAGDLEINLGQRMYPVGADLRVKITAADTALMVADEFAETPPMYSADPTSAAGDALGIAVKQVWPQLLKNILYDWSEKQLDGRKIECVGREIPIDVHDVIVAGLEKADGVKQVSTKDVNKMLSTDWVFTRKPSALGPAIVKASGDRVRKVAQSPGRLEYEMVPPLPANKEDPAVLTPSPAKPEVPVTPPTTLIQDPSTRGQGDGRSRLFPPLPETLPAWALPAGISAVAVVVAFVAGILVARRKGAGRAP